MHNLTSWITSGGYIVLAAIVFAESGVLLGFFLPGDSLLITAGLLAGQGKLNIWILIAVVFVAAVAGDSFGYGFGHRVGRRLFDKVEDKPFRRAFLHRTEVFYAKYGAKTILLARVVPIVRTFAPILAGVGAMPYRKFVRYNIAGGFAWAVSMPLIGYFLGSRIPPEKVDKYLLPGIAVVIVVSVVPMAWELWKVRRKTRSATP